MLFFIIGILILIAGYFTYGKFVEKLFGPDDSHETPAYRLEDGVDYVPMSMTQNSLVQLLNIAGTGPIFGPIAGILWGPIVFLIIPIGNIFAGAVHDYLAGMLSVREDGAQMPKILKKYLGNGTYHVFNIFLAILLILVGGVFVTIPGDIILYNFFGKAGEAVSGANFWNFDVFMVYIAIFVYYFLATMLPVDKVIGKIYPFFGAALLLSALGIFIAIFLKDGWSAGINDYTANYSGHPRNAPLMPLFFTTVACGIISGFHASQSPIIARTMKKESQGRFSFYGMMVIEGFIAMIWAAGGIIAMNVLNVDPTASASVKVVEVSKAALPGFLGTIAVVGLIVLPITSGDTSLRGLRMVISEYLKIDQKPIRKRLYVGLPIFAIAFLIVFWGKMDAAGFDRLWRYFAWMNQATAVFVLFTISAYLFLKFKGKLIYLVSLIPGMFYGIVVVSYFLGGNATREASPEGLVDRTKEIGLALGYSGTNGVIVYVASAIIVIGIVAAWFIHVSRLAKSDFKVS